MCLSCGTCLSRRVEAAGVIAVGGKRRVGALFGDPRTTRLINSCAAPHFGPLPTCATFAASEVAQLGSPNIRSRGTWQIGHQNSHNLAGSSIRTRGTWQRPLCGHQKSRNLADRASEVAQVGKAEHQNSRNLAAPVVWASELAQDSRWNLASRWSLRHGECPSRDSRRLPGLQRQARERRPRASSKAGRHDP
jgi:hypothetical protein